MADAAVDGLHLGVVLVLEEEVERVAGGGDGAVVFLAELLPDGLFVIPRLDRAFGVVAGGKVFRDVHAVGHIRVVLRDGVRGMVEAVAYLHVGRRPVGIEDGDDHHLLRNLEGFETGLFAQFVGGVDDVERREDVVEVAGVAGIVEVGVLAELFAGIQIPLELIAPFPLVFHMYSCIAYDIVGR